MRARGVLPSYAAFPRGGMMELHMSRKIVSPLLALALLAGVSLAACNTVEGVGEDVTAAGQAVDEAAEEAQDTPDA